MVDSRFLQKNVYWVFEVLNFRSFVLQRIPYLRSIFLAHGMSDFLSSNGTRAWCCCCTAVWRIPSPIGRNPQFLGTEVQNLYIAVHTAAAVSIKNDEFGCAIFLTHHLSYFPSKNDSWKFKRQSWKLWQRQFWHNRRRKQRRKYTTLLHVTHNRDRRLTSSSQMFSSVGVHSTRDFISWD